ncbi:hypothetical protein CEE44_02380 [Candidatus Woesearchaeota archaeon B3_Woes]|nr:MAG: hypothetical protein CEE44_02380 [Candidatus Woesearchaeota archaeon B3_Woes]
MKKEISSLEIRYLIKEFQCLIDSKVDSITNPEKEELVMRFFVQGKGKRILRILPNLIYLTNEKKSAIKPSGFCMTLRKYLINSRLKQITQVNSERIIKFLFETKEEKYYLIVELFNKGNIILCDNDNKILCLLKRHKWRDRELKTNVKYNLPPKKVNFFELDKSTIKEILNIKKQLVKKLASEIGLGGVYAEEVCLLSGVDKNKMIPDDKETNLIIKSIKKLIEKKIESCIIYKNKQPLDIIPFPMELYHNLDCKKFENYNSALDFVMSKSLNSIIKDEKTKIYEKKIGKIEKIILKQKEKTNDVEKNIKENEKKAEKIYNNHKLINEILETINNATKKHSWKEIKEKLKDHKIIKEVNSKDKKIILELK